MSGPGIDRGPPRRAGATIFRLRGKVFRSGPAPIGGRGLLPELPKTPTMAFSGSGIRGRGGSCVNQFTLPECSPSD